MSRDRKLKEIVEYRHTAPVKVPHEDVTPEAMHEVIRRLELAVDTRRGQMSPELSKDVCRLLESRHLENLRADRAERREATAYVEGQNAANAVQPSPPRNLVHEGRG